MSVAEKKFSGERACDAGQLGTGNGAEGFLALYENGAIAYDYFGDSKLEIIRCKITQPSNP
jgi:hypothetical protein